MTYTLIHNGTLIDGNGGAPVRDGAVLVQDNRIRAVGRKAGIPLPADPVTMIDAGGGWILPGLIDTHVHLMLEGIDTPG
jgi:imidazolonepropionase-like amidohydrolase